MFIVKGLVFLLFTYFVATRLFLLFKYLIFKINVLELAVAGLAPNEENRKKIRNAVSSVLNNDYEYKTTIKAIAFVKTIGLETTENLPVEYDPKGVIAEIKKI